MSVIDRKVIGLGLAAGLVAASVAGCSSSSPFFGKPGATTAEREAPANEPRAREGSDAGDVSLLAYATASTAPRAAASGEAGVNQQRAVIEALIVKYAHSYAVPVSLVRHVVNRESTYNPAARNGKYWGLMQLNYTTARTMGYRGTAAGLLDADTNLRYGVKYLAGAYLVADGDAVQADRLYQTGYYYRAKRKGLLRQTGLRP